MNPRLATLHAYPFERLAQLKAAVSPPAHLPHIAMSIGEPAFDNQYFTDPNTGHIRLCGNNPNLAPPVTTAP